MLITEGGAFNFFYLQRLRQERVKLKEENEELQLAQVAGIVHTLFVLSVFGCLVVLVSLT